MLKVVTGHLRTFDNTDNQLHTLTNIFEMLYFWSYALTSICFAFLHILRALQTNPMQPVIIKFNNLTLKTKVIMSEGKVQSDLSEGLVRRGVVRRHSVHEQESAAMWQNQVFNDQVLIQQEYKLKYGSEEKMIKATHTPSLVSIGQSKFKLLSGNWISIFSNSDLDHRPPYSRSIKSLIQVLFKKFGQFPKAFQDKFCFQVHFNFS